MRIIECFFDLISPLLRPVILCYHRIDREQFEKHISFFKRKFKVVPLEEIVSGQFSAGKNNIRPVISLTVDDCYEKDFGTLIGCLNKSGLSCTFFVPTGYSENNKTLWSHRLILLFERVNEKFINDQGLVIYFKSTKEKNKYLHRLIEFYQNSSLQTTDLERLVDITTANNNFETPPDRNVISSEIIEKVSCSPLYSFQSHTVTHPKLSLLTEHELIDEFNQSKAYLEFHSHCQQRIICYPYGSRSLIGNAHLIARDHFTYGVTLISGSITTKTDHYMLPRIGIYNHDTISRIIFKILIASLKRQY